MRLLAYIYPEQSPANQDQVADFICDLVVSNSSGSAGQLSTSAAPIGNDGQTLAEGEWFAPLVSDNSVLWNISAVLLAVARRYHSLKTSSSSTIPISERSLAALLRAALLLTCSSQSKVQMAAGEAAALLSRLGEQSANLKQLLEGCTAQLGRKDPFSASGALFTLAQLRTPKEEHVPLTIAAVQSFNRSYGDIFGAWPLYVLQKLWQHVSESSGSPDQSYLHVTLSILSSHLLAGSGLSVPDVTISVIGMFAFSAF